MIPADPCQLRPELRGVLQQMCDLFAFAGMANIEVVQNTTIAGLYDTTLNSSNTPSGGNVNVDAKIGRAHV